jgi:uncharacterized protein YegJ (DUF2314 family)
MPLIIDTYNVLHVVGVLPPELAGIDTEGLVDLIGSSRYRHQAVTLACDGTPAPGGRGAAGGGRRGGRRAGRAPGRVSVRYSGSEATADDLIARLIRRSSIPRRLTVVSSDRAVQREARRRRCHVLSSEAFLRRLVADREARPRNGDGRASTRRRTRPAGASLPPEVVAEAEAIWRRGRGRAPGLAGALLAAGLLAGGTGCQEAAPPEAPPAAGAATSAEIDAAPSPWRSVDGSPARGLAPDETVPGLAEATARARETAEAARRRWLETPAAGRSRWAVKWAARTVDGGIEHLWVEPVRWSPFRVEGRLANPPSRELVTGKRRDDLVGFPLDDLADWVHFATDDPEGPREGGFTIDVLE